MDSRFVRISGVAGRYRNVAALALLAFLIALQFLQIYRYREVIIKNEVNARQLERAAEHAALAAERIARLDTSVQQLQGMTDVRRQIEEMRRAQQDIYARLK